MFDILALSSNPVSRLIAPVRVRYFFDSSFYSSLACSVDLILSRYVGKCYSSCPRIAATEICFSDTPPRVLTILGTSRLPDVRSASD